VAGWTVAAAALRPVERIRAEAAAIVKAVAEAHGGHAGATSSERGGARVVLVLEA
jgi:hypothetical protein